MMLLTAIVVLGLMALSDARSAEKGHNRHKRAVLPTETLTGESGQFTSPGYPQDYAVDIEKSYMIEFPDQQAYYKVTFTVVDMDIEYQQTCSWDYLLIVADAGGPGKLCGVKTNQVYEIQETQGSVDIKFFSDYMYGKKGFNIEYSLEKLSDGCTDSPCNNGTCAPHGRTEFSCTCDDGWMGDTCDTMVGACIADTDCGMNGYCLSSLYECECFSGYTGTHCETAPECDDGSGIHCANRGFCMLNMCQCPAGFTGYQCREDVNECFELSPCSKDAICTNSLGSFSCVCNAGFTGDGYSCSVPDCTADTECNKGGSCQNETCICAPGLLGINCEEDVDECMTLGHSCSENAVCRNTHGAYDCECSYGYRGDGFMCVEGDCTHDFDCQMVNFGATCNINNYTCSCTEGFKGRNCMAAPNCHVDSDCNHNGGCFDGLCSCYGGYSGSHCEHNTFSEFSTTQSDMWMMTSTTTPDMWMTSTATPGSQMMTTAGIPTYSVTTAAPVELDVQRLIQILEQAKQKSLSSKNRMMAAQAKLNEAQADAGFWICREDSSCQSFFFNSRTLECQGHGGGVPEVGTTAKSDNIYFENMGGAVDLPPPSTIPVATTANITSRFLSTFIYGSGFTVFTGQPLSWYAAEAHCQSQSLTLMWMNRVRKLGIVSGRLRAQADLVNETFYIAGIAQSGERMSYFDSGKTEAWESRDGPYDFFVTLLDPVTTSTLQHPTPEDTHMFICEEPCIGDCGWGNV